MFHSCLFIMTELGENITFVKIFNNNIVFQEILFHVCHTQKMIGSWDSEI